MPFRSRRFVSPRRSFRRPRQLNWVTAFPSAPVAVPAATNAFIPLSLQLELETGSDQVIQRVRGNILSAVPVAATAIGRIQFGIFVEDAKDFALANGGALPDPYGLTLEALEPDKYMWLASPWEQNQSQGATNLVGSLSVDVRAKRKLDIAQQQLVLVVANLSSATVTVAYYLRTLLRQVS